MRLAVSYQIKWILFKDAYKKFDWKINKIKLTLFNVINNFEFLS